MISVLTGVPEKRFRKTGGDWEMIGRVNFDEIKNNRVVFSEYHEWVEETFEEYGQFLKL